ncbi:MAG TPA: 30S ribosomal protein S20 [Candidatus Acidoferrales bacterium]|nr:30S ribosomal protein S20 [Candidatus Acidoferrales bacterium]
MAQHKSAVKRHRQSLKRRRRNQHVKSTLRTLVKKVRTAIAGNNREAAVSELREATRALDKAVSKGVLKRNTASRTIARLARRVHLLAQSPETATPAS